VAAASVAPGAINAILVTNPGSGYKTAPEITITGGGEAAIAIAMVSGGQVTGITVTNPGFGYGPSVVNTGTGVTGTNP
jgi:hypothetical protein